MKKEAKVADKASRKENIIRDVACYVVVAYVAVLSFLFVDAKVQLLNAQTEAISNNIATVHAID